MLKLKIRLTMKKEIKNRVVKTNFIEINKKEFNEAFEEKAKSFPKKFLGVVIFSFTKPVERNLHQTFLSYKGRYFEALRPLNESALEIWNTLNYSLRNQ